MGDFGQEDHGAGRKFHTLWAAAFCLLALIAVLAGCGSRSAVEKEPVHHADFVEGAKLVENPLKLKGKEVQFVTRVIQTEGDVIETEMHTNGPRIFVHGKGVAAMEKDAERGDYVRVYGKVAEEDRTGYIAVLDAFKVTKPAWSDLMKSSRSLRSEEGNIEVQILGATAGRDSLVVGEGSISLMPEGAASRLQDIAFIGMTMKIRGEIYDDGDGDFDYLERNGQPMRSGFTLDFADDGTAVFKTEALTVPLEYKDAMKALGVSGKESSVMLPAGTTYRLHYR